MAAALTFMPGAAWSVEVFNAGFETPVLQKAFELSPTPQEQGAGPGDAPWIFTGAAGVAVSGGEMGRVKIPAAPQGVQMGWVDQGGAFSQTLMFPATGNYILRFQEAGIGIYTVFLDDTPILPSHLASTDFTPMNIPFPASAGEHTLRFVDTDPRDIAGPLPAFIDAVAVVPEPAGLGILVLSGLALRRRSR